MEYVQLGQSRKRDAVQVVSLPCHGRQQITEHPNAHSERG